MESKANKKTFLICVDNLAINYQHIYNLTINKEYFAWGIDGNNVLITNDGRTRIWYPLKNFKTKDEIRNNIITEILK